MSMLVGFPYCGRVQWTRACSVSSNRLESTHLISSDQKLYFCWILRTYASYLVKWGECLARRQASDFGETRDCCIHECAICVTKSAVPS